MYPVRFNECKIWKAALDLRIGGDTHMDELVKSS